MLHKELKDVTTELLNYWVKDIKYIKTEYNNGTHDCSSATCRHCKRVRIISTTTTTTDCSECIWWYMTKVDKGLKRAPFMKTLFNSYCSIYTLTSKCSTSVNHDKEEHIARCDRWLAIIDEELSSRKVDENNRLQSQNNMI